MATSIKRALISVSDKSGILELAKELDRLGIEILSTGGTAQLLRQHDIQVIDVSEYTGFPEIMDGRVKTLHSKIHGALLGRRGIDDDLMRQHHIKPIDLLIVNLYPFQQVIQQKDCHLNLAIENIDIGGPTMIRAAAKNYAAVTVIVDANDYSKIINEIKQQSGSISQETRFALAKKAFAHTAQYDTAIATYLNQYQLNHSQDSFPETLNLQFSKLQDLRYGENPHQKAAFYRDLRVDSLSIATATQLQGKELSYNNIVDSDAGLECVNSFISSPACVIIKHANPCGVALGKNPLDAYLKAYKTDPTSAFGGVIAFNQEVDETTVSAILEKQFVEIIVAPGFSAQALKISSSKPNIRLLNCHKNTPSTPNWYYKRVMGGLLVQDNDILNVNNDTLKVVTERTPTQHEMQDLLFAWTVAKFVKSNAIVYAKNQATIGIGAGQMSRVYSAKIAALKAQDEGLTIEGSCMASDAFFPFRDSIETAALAGITAIIQPGGAMRDEEVIQAANKAGIAMVLTGIRHFRH